MPNLFRLMRSQKRRSGLIPSSPLGKKKKDGIFRSNTFRKKSTKKATAEPPVIEAAITYSLSEDEESCGIFLSSDGDIENQFFEEGLLIEDDNDNIAFEKAASPVMTKAIADVEIVDSVETKASDCSTLVRKNDETISFTHLEIMRNELAHMMQIANKDKEIFQLKQDAEEFKIQQTEIVASKDAEIAKIKKALTEVELALSLAQKKIASEEMEHSNTIDVLMRTQYEYHELKSKSWFEPLFCYF